MMDTLKSILYVECILLFRHSREWLYPLSFFLMVICLFPLAFTPDPAFLQKWLPGYIWIAALFACLLSIQHVFATDLEDGHLEQMLLADMPLGMLVAIKLLAQWLVTALPLILMTPLLGWLFGLNLATVSVLALSLFFGTPIIILLGSMAVALTLSLRQKGVLLGLMILPLATPVLIFGIAMVRQTQAGFSMAGPLAFLAGLSLFAFLLFPLAIAAALRIGVDD